MQTLISWNVASVRARLPALLKLLQMEKPDILLLQEIKATEETFPFEALKAAGYHAVISGQKSWNGVAILSRVPCESVRQNLIGLSPEEALQARFIEGVFPDDTHVISLYVPNGNPPEKEPEDTRRFQYKLRWMAALNAYLKDLIRAQKRVIIGGDFNVIERDTDVYEPDLFRTNAVMRPEVRTAFQQLYHLPLYNAVRDKNPSETLYTFWDFKGGSWPRNLGMTLDYFFVSEAVQKSVRAAGVLRGVRGWEKTSDHAPIFCVLS